VLILTKKWVGLHFGRFYQKTCLWSIDVHFQSGHWSNPYGVMPPDGSMVPAMGQDPNDKMGYQHVQQMMQTGPPHHPDQGWYGQVHPHPGGHPMMNHHYMHQGVSRGFKILEKNGNGCGQEPILRLPRFTATTSAL
jgi:hypothetical protein